MGWCDPRTMSTYLDAYYGSTTSRPQPRLSRLLAIPPCATAVAVATLLVECVAVPATLLPASLRPIVGTYSMVALHLGIGLGMSSRVALVFLTTSLLRLWIQLRSGGRLSRLVPRCHYRAAPNDPRRSVADSSQRIGQ